MKTLKIYFLLMLLIQTISISAQSVISGKITNNDSSPIVGIHIQFIVVKVQSQVFIPFSMFSLFQTGGSCKAYTLFFDFLFLNVNDARTA